jgi:hypothetical protein
VLSATGTAHAGLVHVPQLPQARATDKRDATREDVHDVVAASHETVHAHTHVQYELKGRFWRTAGVIEDNVLVLVVPLVLVNKVNNRGGARLYTHTYVRTSG